MSADSNGTPTDPDDFVREVYEAAYRFAVRHGFDGTPGEIALVVGDVTRARAAEGTMTSRRPRCRTRPFCGPRFPGRTRPERRSTMRRMRVGRASVLVDGVGNSSGPRVGSPWASMNHGVVDGYPGRSSTRRSSNFTGPGIAGVARRETNYRVGPGTGAYSTYDDPCSNGLRPRLSSGESVQQSGEPFRRLPDEIRSPVGPTPAHGEDRPGRIEMRSGRRAGGARLWPLVRAVGRRAARPAPGWPRISPDFSGRHRSRVGSSCWSRASRRRPHSFSGWPSRA